MATVIQFAYENTPGKVLFQVDAAKHSKLFRRIASVIGMPEQDKRRQRKSGEGASRPRPTVHIYEMGSVDDLVELTWKIHLKSSKGSEEFMRLMPEGARAEVSRRITASETKFTALLHGDHPGSLF